MTEAETILKMIKAVKPDDENRLNGIDALVRIYVHQLDENKTYLGRPVQYTRSRDALKAIRPEGWEWYMHTHPEHFQFGGAQDCVGLNQVQSPQLPTETLAELHAIIQAIDYERKNDVYRCDDKCSESKN